MSLQYILFDLDDTLYPRDTPIMYDIGECIKTFMMNTLGITYEEAAQRRDRYNAKYGTVVRGLLQEEAVDVDAYLEFVHDIPVTKYLEPNPQLAKMLAEIPLRKFIFTNSYRTHAHNVMTALGVADQFEGVFDIKSVDYVSKPARYPYSVVINKLNTIPKTCIYIDDKVINLKEPYMLGMRTILIDDEPNEWVDVKLDNILEIGNIVQKMLAKETR